MTCPIRLPLPTPTIDTSQTAKTLTPPFSHLKQVENSSRHLLGVTSTDHVHLWSVQSSPPKLLGSYNFNDRLNINQVVVLHAFTPIEFSDIVDAYILDQQSNADDGARRDQDHVERYFDRFEMNVFCVIAGQCTKVDKEQVDDSNFPSFGKETSSGNDVWKFGLVQISPDGLTMIWSWVLCVNPSSFLHQDKKTSEELMWGFFYTYLGIVDALTWRLCRLRMSGFTCVQAIRSRSGRPRAVGSCIHGNATTVRSFVTVSLSTSGVSREWRAMCD